MHGAVTDGDHIYYIGSEQHVHQLYYNNQYWADQDLTSMSNGPLAASGSGLAGYSASDGQHIYYMAANQHVHHLIYANGWVDQDLTAFTSAPLASSSGGLAAYAISDGQHIYYVNDQGLASCRVAATGQEVWTERLGAAVSASPVLIDGNIYVVSESGTVYVFAAAPTFKLVARNKVGDQEQIFASPAVADNRLYIRGAKCLYCIGKAPEKQAKGR